MTAYYRTIEGIASEPRGPGNNTKNKMSGRVFDPDTDLILIDN